MDLGIDKQSEGVMQSSLGWYGGPCAAGSGQGFDLFVFNSCVMLAGTHSPDFSSSHSQVVNMPRFCTVGVKENRWSCSLHPCQRCVRGLREKIDFALTRCRTVCGLVSERAESSTGSQRGFIHLTGNSSVG